MKTNINILHLLEDLKNGFINKIEITTKSEYFVISYGGGHNLFDVKTNNHHHFYKAKQVAVLFTEFISYIKFIGQLVDGEEYKIYYVSPAVSMSLYKKITPHKTLIYTNDMENLVKDGYLKLYR